MKPTLAPQHDALSAKHQALDAEARRATRYVRKGEGRLIRVLREMEDLHAYEPLGYPNLFAYCTKRLHMSEREAGLRIRAVKTVGEFPQVLAALETGRLTLTTLSTMKHMLRAEDVEQTIEKFAHATKFEAEEIVAREAPKPPQKSRIRKMPTARANGGPNRPQPVTPHALDLYKMILMITGTLFREIQELLAMTKRENPTGDLVVFLLACVRAYRAQIEKTMFGSERTSVDGKPSKHATCSTDTAHVTGAAKRAVWKRDGGRCTFVAASGLRCAAREYLEVDHINPRAHGGDGSVDNLRLLCARHHKLVTEATFGRDFVRKKIAEKKNAKKVSAAPTAANATARSGKKRRGRKAPKANARKSARLGHQATGSSKKVVAAPSTARTR